MTDDHLSTLAEQHGTPLYLYDLDQVGKRALALKVALPAGSNLYYSLKANPHPAIVRRLREEGVAAEVASIGELHAALKAGHVADQIVYGGPGKRKVDVLAALSLGVRRFCCESLTDARRLSDCAKEVDANLDCLLRVNPIAAPDARLAMSGVETQFGMDEAVALSPATTAALLALPRLHWYGVHIYLGTQVASVNALVQNTSAALDTGLRVATSMQMDHPVINAGGGFPWPYGTDGEGSSLSELRAELEALLHAAREKVPALQLAFESGRYLSASCGTLVTAVLDVKQSGSKTFVILDTGIHHLGGMSGLGRIPRASLAMKLLNGAGGKLITVDVVGPLCSPLDALARGVTMAEPKPGDLIAIPNVGAYGLSASLVDFLSHPRPVELAIRAGELETSTPPTSA